MGEGCRRGEFGVWGRGVEEGVLGVWGEGDLVYGGGV